MRKRTYNKPMLVMETFAPNQYVAACDLTSTILSAVPICAIPGSSAECADDGIGRRVSDDPAGRKDKGHGSCGGSSGVATINGTTGTEPNGQPFWDLVIGEKYDGNCGLSRDVGTETKWSALVPGQNYKAKWVSCDNSSTVEYWHYGILKVEGYSNKQFS